MTLEGPRTVETERGKAKKAAFFANLEDQLDVRAAVMSALAGSARGNQPGWVGVWCRHLAAVVVASGTDDAAAQQLVERVRAGGWTVTISIVAGAAGFLRLVAGGGAKPGFSDCESTEAARRADALGPGAD